MPVLTLSPRCYLGHWSVRVMGRGTAGLGMGVASFAPIAQLQTDSATKQPESNSQLQWRNIKDPAWR